MRKATWSAAALVILFAALTLLGSPTLRAADTVAMGSDSEPLKFLPAEITVPVGSTVVWENNTDIQHDAVAENGAFDSKLLGKGEKFQFTFNAPGDYAYFCTPHESAGMKGVVKVVPAGGGGATPTTAATTTTTQAPAGGGGATTTTTAGSGQPTTTTTSAVNNAGAPTTTTTAGTADPGVTTSSGPGTTPTSAPDAAGDATTATDGHDTGEAAAGDDHASRGGSEQKNKKTNPLAVAFAGISTVILAGVTGKLLASR